MPEVGGKAGPPERCTVGRNPLQCRVVSENDMEGKTKDVQILGSQCFSILNSLKNGTWYHLKPPSECRHWSDSTPKHWSHRCRECDSTEPRGGSEALLAPISGRGLTRVWSINILLQFYHAPPKKNYSARKCDQPLLTPLWITCKNSERKLAFVHWGVKGTPFVFGPFSINLAWVYPCHPGPSGWWCFGCRPCSKTVNSLWNLMALQIRLFQETWNRLGWWKRGWRSWEDRWTWADMAGFPHASWEIGVTLKGLIMSWSRLQQQRDGGKCFPLSGFSLTCQCFCAGSSRFCWADAPAVHWCHSTRQLIQVGFSYVSHDLSRSLFTHLDLPLRLPENNLNTLNPSSPQNNLSLPDVVKPTPSPRTAWHSGGGRQGRPAAFGE